MWGPGMGAAGPLGWGRARTGARCPASGHDLQHCAEDLLARWAERTVCFLSGSMTDSSPPGPLTRVGKLLAVAQVGRRGEGWEQPGRGSQERGVL